MNEPIHQILKTYWGYDQFRPLQEDIINSILAGNDTLALLPTGGGKSICFQVPGMAKEGICLVISPLIALMKDQVEILQKKGITAQAIYSGMNAYEIELALNQAVNDRLKFLYVSPERLKTNIFIEHFKQMKISLIAVDEAHCISQWGYDFRPPYLEIAQIRPFHPEIPIIALTATATPAVMQDIQDKLSFRSGCKVFRKSFYRSNLIYVVFKEEDKYGRLLRIVGGVKGCGLVYVRNRRKTQEVAEFLQNNGIRSSYYHAGLSSNERDFRQHMWMRDETPVMVATNAFGMGIDKPDVRFVVHLDIPDSPEAYFQEAGRGGRDEKLSYAVMLYSNVDTTNLRQQFEESYPSLQAIRNVYQALCNFYQIPVGNGADSVHDFDASSFCKNYNLKPIQVFSAIKFLEKEGLVELPQYSEATSKVFIPLSKEEIYIFQVENKRIEPFLKCLLRSYGGLFSGFMPINEKELAKRIGSDEISIIKMLELLEKRNVIAYKKKTKASQIVFLSDRVSVDSLYINDIYYKNLKEAALERLKAMSAYVSNNEECRSVSLLHYFGEQDAIPCGHCDVCTAKRKQKQADTKQIAQEIIIHLSEQPVTIRALAEKFSFFDEKELAVIVKKMLEASILEIDSNMRLHYVRKMKKGN